MIETASYTVDTLSQRRRGIYYTPPLAAQAMAAWAVRSNTDRVMEPCFGSGVFLAAIKQVSAARQFALVETHGVELMEAAHGMALATNLIEARHAILGDFLGVKPFHVDAVIGNPPYLRLRSLPENQLKRALSAAREATGVSMDTSGSVWMAFVLHATRFLAPDGRMTLVLPHEFTHVRYARALWSFLGDHFGSLRIARVRERLFPDIMQEAIILFADHHGGATNVVDFEAYQTTQGLVGGAPIVRKQLSLNEIVTGGRPFLKALLPTELTELLNNRLSPLTVPVPESCTFNIGYVSGHKAFFHPDQDTINKFQLATTSLRSALTSSRELAGVGIRTSTMAVDNTRKLFYPNEELSSAEKRYIRAGEQDGVDSGYKCRNREPWYKVPDVRVPSCMLSVFGATPTLVANDGRLVASNSLLCGFLRATCTVEQFLAAWYTSLTLLSCELQVHSLGGGVLVLIPGEVAAVRTPAPSSLSTQHIGALDEALKLGTGNPYLLGDESVLRQSMKLTVKEVELIQEGVRLLANWRSADTTEDIQLPLGENIEE
ncbi:MAG: N-6 DNA methylase [Chloroflexi bacterium]|nr:N-6 DNA methylase [Chloroflexota bacterium]